MQVLTTKNELRQFLDKERTKGKIIGLVPTMGSLHDGHISLIKTSNQHCDLTVASIFVNPTQFNNKEDLAKYPRDVDGDLQKLKSNGCDVVFLPEVQEVYPGQTATKFHFGALETVMEGKFRPGHFNGVATVVCKLFNIVQPHKALFGLKDLQQYTIIKRMVNDLSFNIDIVGVETVREPDGLAMSSRNQRLTEDERQHAPKIFRLLQEAKGKLLNGKEVLSTKEQLSAELSASPFDLEYVEIVDSATLLPIKSTANHSGVHICVAVFLGKVRLIDNILIF